MGEVFIDSAGGGGWCVERVEDGERGDLCVVCNVY